MQIDFETNLISCYCLMISVHTHLLRQQVNVALVSSRWRVKEFDEG